MERNKIKLAIVDDHQIVIDGIRALLKGTDEFDVIIESTQPEKILSSDQLCNVDILLTDVMMPVMNGAELAKEVKRLCPQVKILALSMSGQGEVVNRMIEDSDIAGYVLKNIGQKELINALEKIAAGGIYFSDEILEEMQRASELKKQHTEVHLTAREIEIIRLIENEFNNRQIAEKLFLSERTVETHRKNIFRKTKTGSLIGLIKYAYEHKLIKV